MVHFHLFMINLSLVNLSDALSTATYVTKKEIPSYVFTVGIKWEIVWSFHDNSWHKADDQSIITTSC